jgi:hypothetical protein
MSQTRRQRGGKTLDFSGGEAVRLTSSLEWAFAALAILRGMGKGMNTRTRSM